MLVRHLARLCSILIGALSFAAVANPVQSDHIEVELVSEVTSVAPGEPFWVALRLTPEEDWKTYWRNPGGSGLPTSIRWQLPEGMSAGELQWPYPERFEVQGVVSYGYDGEVLLLARMQPPTDLPTGETVSLGTNAQWLVCRDLCIPGRAELALELPVQSGPPSADPRWAAAFEAARSRLPRENPGLDPIFRIHQGTVHMEVSSDDRAFAGAEAVQFFPIERGLLATVNPQAEQWTDARFKLEQAAAPAAPEEPVYALEGVLVVKTAADVAAYDIQATPAVGLPVAALPSASEATSEMADMGLLAVALLAMAGGALLNLMPCVFPVLSLKAIGLLEAFHVSPRGHHLHGIAYTLGVMVFFAIVSALLLILKAGGAAVGWGFQLQTPWFVGLLAYLLFIMGLSFSGLLEFGGRFMGAGESLTHSGGYMGSFFTGALAAVVASPCTAPFMGSAIAYAVTQPPLYSLTVFLALGFGMALPFLAIAYVPSLGKVLPRPGPWMNHFKQLMAFPMYLTSIWLIWVLGRQTGPTGMALLLIGILLLLFAVWLRHVKPPPKGLWLKLNWGMAGVASVGALAVLASPLLQAPPATAASAGSAELARGGFWEPYDGQRLAALRAQGKPVFLNVTADWCISCIANERVALSLPAVRQAFKDRKVVPMKADWTNRNPQITRILEGYGRSGVPLYVLFPADPQAKPQVLPQWLTPMNVMDVLESLEKKG